MMKFLSLAIVMATLIGSPHKISNIETSGNWIYMYDEKGHRYKSLSASSVGEVKGWGAGFFVSRNGNWIYLYDSEGKRYKSLSASSVGDVIGVAGNTFTSKNGNWIYTWDKNGKKIHSRGAY